MSVDVLPPCLMPSCCYSSPINGCRQGLGVTPMMFQLPVLAGELCQRTKLEGTPQSMQVPKQ